MLGLVSLSFLYIVVVVHCEGKWGQELKVGTCSVEWGWGCSFPGLQREDLQEGKKAVRAIWFNTVQLVVVL